MGKSFSITVQPQDLALEPGGSGRFSVTITNATGLHLDGGRAFITAKASTPKEWFAFVDDAGKPLANQQPEEAYAANESRQYVVQATIPGEAKPAEDYGLIVEAVSVRHPNDVFERGPELTVAVRPKAITDTGGKSRAWIAIAAVGLVILVGGAVAIILALSGEPQVKVPNVVAQPFDQAIINLQAVGLNFGAKEIREDASAAENTVLEQKPAEGSEADVGSGVILVVAARPPKPNAPTVQVPPLKGRMLADASAVLAQAQLVVQVTKKDTGKTVADNTVLDQSPGEATPVPAGSVVTLVVESTPYKYQPKHVRDVMIDRATQYKATGRVDAAVLDAAAVDAATSVRLQPGALEAAREPRPATRDRLSREATTR